MNFICGCRLMAGPQLPKLATRVRFPSSAPKNSCKIIWFCNYFSFLRDFVRRPSLKMSRHGERIAWHSCRRERDCLLPQAVPQNIFLLLFDFVLPPFEKIFRADTVLTSELGSWKPPCFQHPVDHKARDFEQLRHISDRQKCTIFGWGRRFYRGIYHMPYLQ